MLAFIRTIQAIGHSITLPLSWDAFGIRTTELIASAPMLYNDNTISNMFIEKLSD